jgi:hypothetical protein
MACIRAGHDMFVRGRSNAREAGLIQMHARSVPTAETVAGVSWLVTEFCLRNDRPEFGSVAELFKIDGVLQLGPLRIEGREAIAAFFAKRNATHAQIGRITRHICGPVALREISPGVVDAHAALLVFAGVGALPLPSEAPSTVADFDCICERNERGEWQFAERKATVLFISDKASSYLR